MNTNKVKELRSKRLNLSLTPNQYNILAKKARIVGLKPIEFATQAALGKNIFSLNSQILMNLLLTDYRKQIGFSKLVLRDCDVTDEVERIANNTIYDFKGKIENLESIRREEDENWRNYKKDQSCK